MNKSAYTLVFGLTADPIHKGHEQVILNSFEFAQANNIGIQKFLLVPTYQANLIADKTQPSTAFKHRFNMCELVAEQIRIENNIPVYVSDIEQQLFLETNKKSYSYDTLTAIEAAPKLFVLSADHFAGRWPKFRKWHNWQSLTKEHGLLIHQRPGHNINDSFINQLQDLNPNVFVVTGLPSINISSTQLRATISCDLQSVSEFLSASSIKYIKQHGLY